MGLNRRATFQDGEGSSFVWHLGGNSCLQKPSCLYNQEGSAPRGSWPDVEKQGRTDKGRQLLTIQRLR